MTEVVYIVETESGSCEENGAMLFDSVWSTREKAEEYCKKFHPSTNIGGFGHGWEYEITEVLIDEPS